MVVLLVAGFAIANKWNNQGSNSTPIVTPMPAPTATPEETLTPELPVATETPTADLTQEEIIRKDKAIERSLTASTYSTDSTDETINIDPEKEVVPVPTPEPIAAPIIKTTAKSTTEPTPEPITEVNDSHPKTNTATYTKPETTTVEKKTTVAPTPEKPEIAIDNPTPAKTEVKTVTKIYIVGNDGKIDVGIDKAGKGYVLTEVKNA